MDKRTRKKKMWFRVVCVCARAQLCVLAVSLFLFVYIVACLRSPVHMQPPSDC